MIDFTHLIRQYVDQMDGFVEDLSYNLEGIVTCYNEYRHRRTNIRDFDPLIEMFLHSRYVENIEDAEKLASRALLTLYPDMTEVLQQLDYTAGIIHKVRIHMTRDKRMVSCTVLMKVI